MVEYSVSVLVDVYVVDVTSAVVVVAVNVFSAPTIAVLIDVHPGTGYKLAQKILAAGNAVSTSRGR